MNDEIKEMNLSEMLFNRDERLLDYITNLQQERDKFKVRCFNALKMIYDNYGLLDKYGIELLEDILKGDSNE